MSIKKSGSIDSAEDRASCITAIDESGHKAIGVDAEIKASNIRRLPASGSGPAAFNAWLKVIATVQISSPKCLPCKKHFGQSLEH